MEDAPDGGRRCDCRNPECQSPGKHPWTRNGFKSATTEPELIRKYWERWPRANIGIATGRISGLVVVDIDPRNGGDDSFAALEAEHGAFPDTIEVLTGGGGRHLYCKYPGENALRGRAGAWRGVDIKADGGYVIAPPSNHASGALYEWEASGDPFDEDSPAQLCALPDWVLEQMLAPKTRDGYDPTQPVGEGGRNDHLAKLAGALRKRGCSAEVIATSLHAANREQCDPPLPDDEVEAIARSISRYAPEDTAPITIEVVAPTADGKAADPGISLPSTQTLCTDMGNAQRLISHFGNHLRYIPEWKRWLVWEGRHWIHDPQGLRTMRFAKETVRRIYLEAAQCEDDGKREQLSKWAITSQGRARLDAMIALARDIGDTLTEPDAFDRELDILNVGNGILNIYTGELEPHDPRRQCSKFTRVRYDADARCPRWEQFLVEIMDGNANLISFLQRAVGYTLTGSTDEQVLFLPYGPQANGKSTFLKIMRRLLGDYARSADPSIFMVRDRKEGANNDLARLAGSRFVSAVETEEGQRLAEALIKQATGEDTLTARFLYSEYFEYEPQFKVWLACNHKPVVRSGGPALWRRLMLLPFSVTIPLEQRDPGLAKALTAELPGILNWALRGANAWKTGRLRPPEEVIYATNAYQQEMDVVGTWIEECCELDPTEATLAQEAHKSFSSWQRDRGERPWSQKVFGSQLTDRGFKRTRHPSNRRWMYVGFRILEPEIGPKF